MSLDTYLGSYVFPYEPDWSSPPGISLYDEVQKMQGRIMGFMDSFRNDPSIIQTISLVQISRVNIWGLLDFFDTMAGRYDSFWMPTYKRDIVVNLPFVQSASNLSIEDTGAFRYFSETTTLNRNLMLKFLDGTKVYRAYDPISDFSIRLSSSIDKECSVNELDSLLVSYLNKVRFASDEIEIEFHGSEVASAIFDIVSTDTSE